MTSILYQQIQKFYDASSGLWEQIWGEHMHHGYYGVAGNHRKDRRQAQIDLIEEMLAWAEVGQAAEILDVGCGIGGSSLYLADKFNANVVGITLSPVQASRAVERAQAIGMNGDANGAASAQKRPYAQFQVVDALNTPFADHQFDFIWSMESGEHMPDKLQFLQECYRLLKPDGVFLMATWCHRHTNSLAGALTPDEQTHLQAIYQVYCLPYVIALSDYEAIAHQIGFQQIRVADWSMAVAPFWDKVIDSALNPSTITGLLRSGWPAIQGALSLGLMQRGFERGLIRYGLLYGVK